MAYKDVIVDIRVKLSVPEDGEYDIESYFAELRTLIDDNDEGWEEAEALAEVDTCEVALLTPLN
jgi:hypothetical protein